MKSFANYTCPTCHKIVATEDRRRMAPSLVAIGHAKLKVSPTGSPYILCSCGQSVPLTPLPVPEEVIP